MRRLMRLAIRAIVLMWILPLGTYWLVAKSFWVHTALQKGVLVGLTLSGVLLFASTLKPPNKIDYGQRTF